MKRDESERCLRNRPGLEIGIELTQKIRVSSVAKKSCHSSDSQHQKTSRLNSTVALPKLINKRTFTPVAFSSLIS